ncbi:hypothetical protein GCM10007854_08780 [Algimonas porphyrae]|uniref:DUF1289 domain-containing protein n=2 Tax=Algimonas porphyrae TaxID=1128113 RepID=A0ABQ5UX90_9PROT|nr:hypothetical protein GCM10007854_08780 [Algimonas porphyrae]
MTPEEIAALEPVESPCVLICSMDRESGFCFGCGRTTDEIAYWGLRSKEERDVIMAELPARMPELKAKLEERRKKRRTNRRRK